jgi:hypothetical protein
MDGMKLIDHWMLARTNGRTDGQTKTISISYILYEDCLWFLTKIICKYLSYVFFHTSLVQNIFKCNCRFNGSIIVFVKTLAVTKPQVVTVKKGNNWYVNRFLIDKFDPCHVGLTLSWIFTCHHYICMNVTIIIE